MKKEQWSLKEVYMVPKHFYHQLKGLLSKEHVSELERANKEGQNDTKEDEKQGSALDKSLNDITLEPMPMAPAETISDISILPSSTPPTKVSSAIDPPSTEEKLASPKEKISKSPIVTKNGWYKCTICNQSFRGNETYQNHLVQKHSSGKLESTPKETFIPPTRYLPFI